MTDPRDDDTTLARWRDSAATAAGRAYEAAHGREIDDESRGLRWAISPRVALTAGGALVVVALLAWALLRPSAELGAVPPAATSASPTASVVAVTAADAGEGGQGEGAPGIGIVVHVSGDVAEPGLVELGAGQRVADAIELAGGALEDADLSAINLARVPSDGEQIDVPAIGEAPAEGAATVSLNQADARELEELPGIGPVTAEQIVTDREANGPFASLEDLQRVTGVGPATTARLEGLATP